MGGWKSNKDASDSENDNEFEEGVTSTTRPNVVSEEAVMAQRTMSYENALKCRLKGQHNEAAGILTSLIAELEALPDESKSNQQKRLYHLCLRNLGSIEQSKGNAEVSAWLYCRAVTIDNTDVVLWSQLGKAARDIGNLRLARFAYEQGLICVESHIPCMIALSQVLFMLEEYYLCLSLVDKVLDKEPNHAVTLLIKSDILMKSGSKHDTYIAYELGSKASRLCPGVCLPSLHPSPPMDTVGEGTGEGSIESHRLHLQTHSVEELIRKSLILYSEILARKGDPLVNALCAPIVVIPPESNNRIGTSRTSPALGEAVRGTDAGNLGPSIEELITITSGENKENSLLEIRATVPLSKSTSNVVDPFPVTDPAPSETATANAAAVNTSATAPARMEIASEVTESNLEAAAVIGGNLNVATEATDGRRELGLRKSDRLSSKEAADNLLEDQDLVSKLSRFVFCEGKNVPQTRPAKHRRLDDDESNVSASARKKAKASHSAEGLTQISSPRKCKRWEVFDMPSLLSQSSLVDNRGILDFLHITALHFARGIRMVQSGAGTGRTSSSLFSGELSSLMKQMCTVLLESNLESLFVTFLSAELVVDEICHNCSDNFVGTGAVKAALNKPLLRQVDALLHTLNLSLAGSKETSSPGDISLFVRLLWMKIKLFELADNSRDAIHGCWQVIECLKSVKDNFAESDSVILLPHLSYGNCISIQEATNIEDRLKSSTILVSARERFSLVKVNNPSDTMLRSMEGDLNGLLSHFNCFSVEGLKVKSLVDDFVAQKRLFEMKGGDITVTALPDAFGLISNIYSHLGHYGDFLTFTSNVILKLLSGLEDSELGDDLVLSDLSIGDDANVGTASVVNFITYMLDKASATVKSSSTVVSAPVRDKLHQSLRKGFILACCTLSSNLLKSVAECLRVASSPLRAVAIFGNLLRSISLEIDLTKCSFFATAIGELYNTLEACHAFPDVVGAMNPDKLDEMKLNALGIVKYMEGRSKTVQCEAISVFAFLCSMDERVNSKKDISTLTKVVHDWLYDKAMCLHRGGALLKLLMYWLKKSCASTKENGDTVMDLTASSAPAVQDHNGTSTRIDDDSYVETLMEDALSGCIACLFRVSIFGSQPHTEDREGPPDNDPDANKFLLQAILDFIDDGTLSMYSPEVLVVFERLQQSVGGSVSVSADVEKYLDIDQERIRFLDVFALSDRASTRGTNDYFYRYAEALLKRPPGGDWLHENVVVVADRYDLHESICKRVVHLCKQDLSINPTRYESWLILAKCSRSIFHLLMADMEQWSNVAQLRNTARVWVETNKRALEAAIRILENSCKIDNVSTDELASVIPLRNSEGAIEEEDLFAHLVQAYVAKSLSLFGDLQSAFLPVLYPGGILTPYAQKKIIDSALQCINRGYTIGKGRKENDDHLWVLPFLKGKLIWKRDAATSYRAALEAFSEAHVLHQSEEFVEKDSAKSVEPFYRLHATRMKILLSFPLDLNTVDPSMLALLEQFQYDRFGDAEESKDDGTKSAAGANASDVGCDDMVTGSEAGAQATSTSKTTTAAAPSPVKPVKPVPILTISAAEQQRLDNMKRNAEMLSKLGLPAAVSSLAQSLKSKGTVVTAMEAEGDGEAEGETGEETGEGVVESEKKNDDDEGSKSKGAAVIAMPRTSTRQQLKKQQDKKDVEEVGVETGDERVEREVSIKSRCYAVLENTIAAMMHCLKVEPYHGRSVYRYAHALLHGKRFWEAHMDAKAEDDLEGESRTRRRFTCGFDKGTCFYSTDRKDNLQRHIRKMHLRLQGKENPSNEEVDSYLIEDDDSKDLNIEFGLDACLGIMTDHLFERRRPQVVKVFREIRKNGNPWWRKDMLVLKYDSTREKYVQFYTSLLSVKRDYVSQEKMLKWVLGSHNDEKKKHPFIWHWSGLLLRDLLSSISYLIRANPDVELTVEERLKMLEVAYTVYIHSENRKDSPIHGLVDPNSLKVDSAILRQSSEKLFRECFHAYYMVTDKNAPPLTLGDIIDICEKNWPSLNGKGKMARAKLKLKKKEGLKETVSSPAPHVPTAMELIATSSLLS